MKFFSIFVSLFISLQLIAISAIAQEYTLQNDDVIIKGGIIQYCYYDFTIKNIIIPEELNGQTVIGIQDKSYSLLGVFAENGIESIKLPSTIKFIGENAFYLNNISELDLESLPYLERIGKSAFRGNNIQSLSISNCSSLKIIDVYAFAFCNIEILEIKQCIPLVMINKGAFMDNMIHELNFTDCNSLEEIGPDAFSANKLESIVFSNVNSLHTIGGYAFYNNILPNIDLSNCNQLTLIESNAFSANNLSEFNLPVCSGYESYGWKDEEGNLYETSQIVTDLSKLYLLNFAYTLTDDDVIVENNYIQSGNFDYRFKSIKIPEILDGQTIKGIRDGEENEGVFDNKDILEVIFPSSIEHIGDHAFNNNKIYFLDLSHLTNLEYIGNYAFLLSVHSQIFDLSQLNKLDFLGEYFFGLYNSVILPNCTLYENYGWINSNGATYNAGDKIYPGEYYYYVPYPYILKDEDVIIENGIIVSSIHRIPQSELIIPDTLQNQIIIGIADNDTKGIFEDEGHKSIELPSTIEFIGNRAFHFNDITDVNFENCPDLERIGKSAFSFNNLVNIDLNHNTNLKTIDDNAFDYSHVKNLNLQNCSNLKEIGNSAFNNHNLQTLDLSSCTQLERIGENAFRPYYNSNNKIETLNLSGCNNLHSISRGAFYDNNLESVDLSGCTSLAFIGSAAFSNNQLDTFIFPQCAGYEQYGWNDQHGDHYVAGSPSSDLSFLYYVPYDYILNDDDVVIENGIIKECLYNFQFKSIVIPDILQGQTVTQIANSNSSDNYQFGGKDLVKIRFPLTIELIGDYTFIHNSFLDLDFTNCSNLLKIGKQSFGFLHLLENLDLTGCSSLKIIDDWAFYANSLQSVNISNCNSLMNIGKGIFSENGPGTFQLPVCYGFESLGWKDNLGNTYMGGESVPSNGWDVNYYVPFAPYTLEDYDVEMENGIIQSCSYNFSIKQIIIPDNLQDQEVSGIASKSNSENGVFASKHIASIEIPYSLTYLGDYSLNNNQLDNFETENFPHLRYIGANSLSNNNFNEITLPDPTANGYDYWEDGYGNIYNSSQIISDLTTPYSAHMFNANTLNFKVQNNNENAIYEATVVFNMQTQTTNTSGIAIFEDVLTGNYQYQIAKNGYTTKYGSISISTDTTILVKLLQVGIVDLNEITYNLYPNPTTNIFSINFKPCGCNKTISILDLNGLVLHTIETRNDIIRMDISTLKRGIYILKLEIGDKIYSEKIVKY